MIGRDAFAKRIRDNKLQTILNDLARTKEFKDATKLYEEIHSAKKKEKELEKLEFALSVLKSDMAKNVKDANGKELNRFEKRKLEDLIGEKLRTDMEEKYYPYKKIARANAEKSR